jgi:hypothetical protein
MATGWLIWMRVGWVPAVEEDISSQCGKIYSLLYLCTIAKTCPQLVKGARSVVVLIPKKAGIAVPGF